MLLKKKKKKEESAFNSTTTRKLFEEYIGPGHKKVEQSYREFMEHMIGKMSGAHRFPDPRALPPSSSLHDPYGVSSGPSGMLGAIPPGSLTSDPMWTKLMGIDPLGLTTVEPPMETVKTYNIRFYCHNCQKTNTFEIKYSVDDKYPKGIVSCYTCKTEYTARHVFEKGELV